MLKRLTAIGLMLVLLLAAFGTAADAPADGRAGRAEMRFLQGMSDHHQMALDMAQDCLAKEVSDDLRALCQAVIDAQTPEIEQMQAWLLDWYNIAYATMPMSDMQAMMPGADAAMDHSAHGGHSAASEGPFTDPAAMMGMFAGFNRLEGAAYEQAWLESMIDHHDDAIHMAERILTRGQHPALIALAETIIADQTAEIDMMKTMLATRNAE